MTPDQFDTGLQHAIEEVGAAPVRVEVMLDPIKEGFDENFSRAVDSGGGAWAPRQDEGDGHPLLRETGGLWAALLGHGAGNVVEIGDKSLAIGVDPAAASGPSGLAGAAVHNFGYDGPGFGGTRTIHIPQREYVYASADTLDKMADVLADEVLDSASAALTRTLVT